MDIYLVGGAVRDALLGLPVKDRDWVVVGATPEDMLAAGYKQVGADFPVFLHPQTREEYALARTERKQGHGYHGFTVYSAPDVTLEEDLQRRDLTINAMAQTVDGEVVDPFGGQSDLQARLLRHVSPAFEEDPLRILRTARFAARFAPLGFGVADETMDLMREMVEQGEVDHLVAERVWQETQRALHEQAPRVYFEVLRACGALAVVMPEVDGLMEGQQGGAVAVLAAPTGGMSPVGRLEQACALSEDTPVRWAALIAGLDDGSRDRLNERLKVPNDCKTLPAVAESMRQELLDEPELTAERIRNLVDAGDGWRRPERFAQLLIVLEASGIPKASTDLLEKAREAASQVDPKQLMAAGYKGKALGEAIQAERLRRVEREVAGSRL